MTDCEACKKRGVGGTLVPKCGAERQQKGRRGERLMNRGDGFCQQSDSEGAGAIILFNPSVPPVTISYFIKPPVCGTGWSPQGVPYPPPGHMASIITPLLQLRACRMSHSWSGSLWRRMKNRTPVNDIKKTEHTSATHNLVSVVGPLKAGFN